MALRGLLLRCALACSLGAVCIACGPSARGEPSDRQTTPPPTLTPPSRATDAPAPQAAATVRALFVSASEDIGVAALGPGHKIFGVHLDTQFPMASVTKLVIMLGVLNQSIVEHRPLASYERDALAAMMSYSDNDSATALWVEAGRGGGLARYLQSIGVTGVTFADDDEWGDSTASPRALATLLQKLGEAKILDPETRAVALGLLASVEPDQAWGVTAGFAVADRVGVKNGWYFDGSGWWVNSAGMDWSPPSARVIVIMSREQPAFDTAVAQIEAMARLLGSILAAP